MILDDDRDGDRRRKSKETANSDSPHSTTSQRKRTNGDPELGSALRSVYQRTIDEAIPPEMLDLLGKLG